MPNTVEPKQLRELHIELKANQPEGKCRQRILALRGHRLYVGFMAAEHDELREMPPPTPAPAELSERAAALVRQHRDCFWFWHPDALSQPETRLRHLEDVRLVVEHLREYGDHRAWWDAQELHRCLSPLYKKTS